MLLVLFLLVLTLPDVAFSVIKFMPGTMFARWQQNGLLLMQNKPQIKIILKLKI